MKTDTAEALGNVVVVDDNPATLYSTSRVLRSAGYSVVEANTGTKGLQSVGPQTSLVVLDINLPDIDGYQISRMLRARPETSSLPILHLSATFVDELDKVTGFEAGADAYLTHPVEPLVLLATASAVLRARKAEERTRESEAKFRAIFQNVPTGIGLLDESLAFIDANPAMCRLLGMERAEFPRSKGERVIFDTESRREDVRRELLERRSWHGETTCVRSDETTVDLDWHISAFPTGMTLALATDVTERRRVEIEREQLLESERVARADAERASRFKDDFLATLSHELRNPLQSIVSWSSVLSKTITDPALQPGLRALDRGTLLLTQLIGDLLDVARISSGKISLEIDAVDLERIVDAAVQVAAPSLTAKRIRIERVHCSQGALIHGDAARLQQVVWNLLTNAIKFTPDGGTIWVRIERDDTHVTLSVTDDGCGIAPEFLPRIFERFAQSGNQQDRAGGLGLGLAIVKNLVEMHGGRVEVRSEGLGRGSTFLVTLPTAAAGTHTPAPAA